MYTEMRVFALRGAEILEARDTPVQRMRIKCKFIAVTRTHSVK